MSTTPLRLVTVGGSITTGYAASPTTNGWAGQVARALDTRLDRGCQWVSRGVSGTDSVSACLRIAEHAAEADLVVLEFAVNDQWLDATLRRQSYEGLLRQVLCLPSRPRVLCLFLGEQDGSHSVGDEQRIVADFYGVPWVKVEPQEGNWNPSDPIHPNDQGHTFIAQTVLGALEAVLAAPSPAPANPRQLRDPLYSPDWQFARFWDHRNAAVVSAAGWKEGSDVHGEWVAHGGAPSGWHTSNDDALLEVTVSGKVVGVLYSESEHYRNLEAQVDGGPWILLQGHVDFRKGYLGWAYRALSRALEDGPHTVRVRFTGEEKGSGRVGHVVALVAAGGGDTGTTWVTGAPLTGEWRPPAELPLRWTGRFDPAALPGARFGWQLSRLDGHFTGPRLSLRFARVTGRNHFDLLIDGRSRLLTLHDTSPHIVTVADDLGPGEHRFTLVKRSEGFFGSADLTGLSLSPGQSWSPPAPARPWRLEAYGDSITAGACNEDGEVDQYDTLLTHDCQLSYAALAARRLNAELVSLAVSGTGLTCSWNPILMPQVWDRCAPSLDAPKAPTDAAPHIVVLNLGQNDYGYPQSLGQPFDTSYGPALAALVQGLRRRYPEAWIVGALGGMTGWKECEPLRRQWEETWSTLGQADARLRWFTFQAASSAHPRVDVHAVLAEELTAFLTREVGPHLETPLH